MCLLWVLANAGRVEISFGVLESSLSVLEEEGLEDRVSSLEAFWGGMVERRLICLVKIGG